MTASLHNSVTSSRVRCAWFTSSRLLNRMTYSTAEYQSTPNGQVYALLTQISMMSFSKMEEASIGVPSTLVIVINSTLFQNKLGGWNFLISQCCGGRGYGHCGGNLPLPIHNFAVLVWIQQVHIYNTPPYIVQYNCMLLKVASTSNL